MTASSDRLAWPPSPARGPRRSGAPEQQRADDVAAPRQSLQFSACLLSLGGLGSVLALGRLLVDVFTSES